MNIIVDKEMFVTYLESSFIKTKSLEKLSLIQIFENENNKILLTQYMIERIESQIKDIPSLLNQFQMFINELSHDKRFLAQNISERREEKEIIKVFDNNLSDDCLFVFVKTEKSDYNAIKFQCCFWDNINKPNKDYLILFLASRFHINVRYSDFENDEQIIHFFEQYFKFSNKTKNIMILDSYCNYSGLSLFDSISNKGYKISVFTSAFKKNVDEINRLRKSIKENLGKSTSVKFSSDKRLLHERTIIINDFILESNHDFAEIKRKNENWKIDISYDKNIRELNEKKCLAYN